MGPEGRGGSVGVAVGVGGRLSGCGRGAGTESLGLKSPWNNHLPPTAEASAVLGGDTERD